jgi:hypothetical protein
LSLEDILSIPLLHIMSSRWPAKRLTLVPVVVAPSSSASYPLLCLFKTHDVGGFAYVISFTAPLSCRKELKHTHSLLG